jgi:ribosomal protein S18 acetylase RimI-like enzyme
MGARMEWSYKDFVIDDDNQKTDAEAVHRLLKDTYWAKGRELETVKKTIANSHCFNVRKDGRQIGFARVVTDYAVFGWIADVIIEEEFRGLGLGKFLVKCICEHPDIPEHTLVLRTTNAHGLYEKYGFKRNEFMSR